MIFNKWLKINKSSLSKGVKEKFKNLKDGEHWNKKFSFIKKGNTIKKIKFRVNNYADEEERAPGWRNKKYSYFTKEKKKEIKKRIKDIKEIIL